MSLYCDLRVAADDARFALPEVTLGYIPSAGGTQTLPRHVGRSDALAMVTGFGGGVIRDVLLNQRPVAFQQNAYMITAIAAALAGFFFATAFLAAVFFAADFFFAAAPKCFAIGVK